jgi:hypothetical protein
MITVALSDAISFKLIVFPDTVSGKENGGASLPRGNMVDSVKDIRD